MALARINELISKAASSQNARDYAIHFGQIAGLVKATGVKLTKSQTKSLREANARLRKP